MRSVIFWVTSALVNVSALVYHLCVVYLCVEETVYNGLGVRCARDVIDRLENITGLITL